jgi:hypothetical protein
MMITVQLCTAVTTTFLGAATWHSVYDSAAAQDTSSLIDSSCISANSSSNSATWWYTDMGEPIVPASTTFTNIGCSGKENISICMLCYQLMHVYTKSTCTTRACSSGRCSYCVMFIGLADLINLCVYTSIKGLSFSCQRPPVYTDCTVPVTVDPGIENRLTLCSPVIQGATRTYYCMAATQNAVFKAMIGASDVTVLMHREATNHSINPVIISLL